MCDRCVTFPGVRCKCDCKPSLVMGLGFRCSSCAHRLNPPDPGTLEYLEYERVGKEKEAGKSNGPSTAPGGSERDPKQLNRRGEAGFTILPVLDTALRLSSGQGVENVGYYTPG